MMSVNLNDQQRAVALPMFEAGLRQRGLEPPRRESPHTLQINVGKRCNQACLHCHVEAGPKRPEMMSRETAERVVALLAASPGVRTLDITGGAPELNSNFRFLVESAVALGRRVIDRCNLTVLFEPGQETLAAFLADHDVAIVASLPCYSAENVDRQRGGGVFDKSIAALRRLNELGYGEGVSGRRLDLVYNPLGPTLPPAQAELEGRYRVELQERFGVRFSRLLTITNVPVGRFAHDLERGGKLSDYLDLLQDALNAATLPELMCRTLVSVDWEGRLYDCDFNQMLAMPIGAQARQRPTLWDVEDLEHLAGGAIAMGVHCYACTAGAGSSCGGALAGATGPA